MERTIDIGGVPCRLKTSAALPRLYRQLLGRDVFADVGAVFALFGRQEDDDRVKLEIDTDGASGEQLRGLDFIEDLTYIMHKHGDPAQPDTVEEWMAQFDDAGAVFDVIGDVLGLWFADNRQTATAQKKTGRPTGK